MNVNINIDWKFVAALGLTVSGTILCCRLHKDQVASVLENLITFTSKELITTK